VKPLHAVSNFVCAIIPNMYINLKEAQGICFSSCEGCRTSCCDGGRFMLAPLVLNDLENVYKNFLTAFAYIDGNLRLVMLISNRKKPCSYFKDGRCTIYNERPPACTMYPFTPYFDDVLIDTACEAVGFAGFELQMPDKEGLEQVHPSFYHPRLERFSDKYNDTVRFLERIDENFEVLLEIEGIALMAYKGSLDNEVIKMHQASLRHITSWT
jgi:uncharacterized protein